MEELYDVNADPDEMRNLAGDPKYKAKLQELRIAYKNWNSAVGDMSDMPEAEMVSQWWYGKKEPPVTSSPDVSKSAGWCYT